MARQDTLAAVDLGSNSFHLEIGRVVDRQIYPLDAVREVVRLGGGLTLAGITLHGWVRKARRNRIPEKPHVASG